jgi:hypothetical protein
MKGAIVLINRLLPFVTLLIIGTPFVFANTSSNNEASATLITETNLKFRTRDELVMRDKEVFINGKKLDRIWVLSRREMLRSILHPLSQFKRPIGISCSAGTYYLNISRGKVVSGVRGCIGDPIHRQVTDAFRILRRPFPGML